MPVVSSDLAVQWSTRFETLFQAAYNQYVAIEQARLAPLAMDLTLGDHQGNTVNLDWLGAAPQMRKWVDEKRAQGLSKNTWQAIVENYEASIEIDLNTFNDARGNIYEPRFKEMAQNASRIRYNITSDLIRLGSASLNYDGQFFFDTDHSEGVSGTQSNKLTGAGVTLANITTDYYKAKSALAGFKDDKGEVMAGWDFRPLIWIPNAPTLVEMFSTLQAALVISQTNNILAGGFDLVIDPKLTDLTDWFMFRTDTPMKSLIFVMREEPHYEDNFDSKSDNVFNRRIGMASVVGRLVGTYGMWQRGVQVVNS